MTATEPQATARKPKLRWFQYRLGTLLLATAAASGCPSWQAYRAEQQASAVAALRELGVHVTSRVRDPQWLWSPFGERLGRTVVRADCDSDKLETAIPHLKACPDLEQVVVLSWPPDGTQGPDARARLQKEMPHVRTLCLFVTVDCVSVTETVHVPDGGSALLLAIRIVDDRDMPNTGRN